MRVSIRHMMIVIAVIGSAVFAVRVMFLSSTVFSAGYDESRFRQIRMEMTSEEVEALLGPPLKKVPWPEAGIVMWLYTEPRPRYSDYWRRDVFMKDDKVCQAINMYWVD